MKLAYKKDTYVSKFMAALLTKPRYGISLGACESWMDKENIIYIHNGVLSTHKQEWNPVICREMDGNRGYHLKQNKSDTERESVTCFILYMVT